MISFGVFVLCFVGLTYSLIPNKVWNSFYAYQKARVTLYIWENDLPARNATMNPRLRYHNRLLTMRIKKYLYISNHNFAIWKKEGELDKQSIHISGTQIKDTKEILHQMRKSNAILNFDKIKYSLIL